VTVIEWNQQCRGKRNLSVFPLYSPRSGSGARFSPNTLVNIHFLVIAPCRLACGYTYQRSTRLLKVSSLNLFISVIRKLAHETERRQNWTYNKLEWRGGGVLLKLLRHVFDHDRNSDDIMEDLVWYYDMHTNFWSKILNDGHQAGELVEERYEIFTGL